jgi:hypothetical protein
MTTIFVLSLLFIFVFAIFVSFLVLTVAAPSLPVAAAFIAAAVIPTMMFALSFVLFGSAVPRFIIVRGRR